MTTVPTEQQIVQRYQSMRQELTILTQKVQELDAERTEHATVIKQLERLEGDRKCFRLVGGVLVERTVKDVLPALITNRDQVAKIVETLTKQFEEQNAALIEFEKKYNIRVKNDRSEAKGGKSSGVLV